MVPKAKKWQKKNAVLISYRIALLVSLLKDKEKFIEKAKQIDWAKYCEISSNKACSIRISLIHKAFLNI